MLSTWIIKNIYVKYTGDICFMVLRFKNDKNSVSKINCFLSFFKCFHKTKMEYCVMVSIQWGISRIWVLFYFGFDERYPAPHTYKLTLSNKPEDLCLSRVPVTESRARSGAMLPVCSA